MSWKAGASRQDVTCYEEGIYLFGWGRPDNKALGVATPMFARAMVLDDGTTPIAIVLVDIGIITYTLRRFALQALREMFPDCPIRDEQILLTATHTHSAPSGYCEYLFYGFSGPGLSRHITDTYARGIARAIGNAWNQREDATVRLGDGHMPLSVPVAFNRSFAPYLKNPEYVDAPPAAADEATHRTMSVLRADSVESNTPIGIFSWFATHGTSVHGDHTEVHCDNRGLAAVDYEAQLKKRYGHHVVTAFAQESAGDITPNFRWDRHRKFTIGAKDDDHESAQFVADALRLLADRIVTNVDALTPLAPTTAGTLAYVRLSEFEFDSEMHDTRVQTGDAVLGIGFMEGTKEGPGPIRALYPVLRQITGALRRTNDGLGRELRAHHGNKIPFLDTGKGQYGELFGLFPLQRPNLPAALDQTIRTYKYYRTIGALDDTPWSPTVLPFQVLRIGHLWLTGVPGEPTTTTGRRIRAALARDIASAAVSCGTPEAHPPRIVVAAYSNDYASYITTYEEYFEQWYEGASTMFGPHTGEAVSHILRRLTASLLQGTPSTLPHAAPPRFEERLFRERDYRSAPDVVRGHPLSEN